MPARVLVLHYSRTGRTRSIAEFLARALGADLEEIREPDRDRRGVPGFLRSGVEALLGASAEIEGPRRDPSAYDVAVIGGPVWLHRPASPVRTYLRRERDRLPHIALFA